MTSSSDRQESASNVSSPCAGCTFADFSGDAVVSVGNGDASISMANCTLANNTIWPDTWYDEGHALIRAVSSEYQDDYDPWIILKTTVAILLYQCQMEGNSAQHTLLATGGDEAYEPNYFSSTPMDVYLLNYGKKVETKSPAQAPTGTFLTGDDEWIRELQKVPLQQVGCFDCFPTTSMLCIFQSIAQQGCSYM
jgi:hypothetical protein